MMRLGPGKGIAMKRLVVGMIALSLGVACSAAQADYSVENKGSWPDSWPHELEPLRQQAQTLVGPLVPQLHYAIPFSTREEFEAAWPHLLKVKTPGAPIVLRRGPSFWLGKEAAAGVVVHTPPTGKAAPADAKSVGNRIEKTIYVELIVDGQFVDLNRIALPPDTPIVDQRFAEEVRVRQGPTEATK
jgi:hypothetical protein